MQNDAKLIYHGAVSWVRNLRLSAKIQVKELDPNQMNMFIDFATPRGAKHVQV